MNKTSKRIILVLAALFAVATLPTVVAAAGLTPFSATGAITRLDPGTESVDPSTGGLLTTGQVFTGTLNSAWEGLQGAQIRVLQNSLIGIDPAILAATGSSPLEGAAWGGFDVTADDGALAGSYQASIVGFLHLDPFGSIFGCTFTSTLGPIDFNGDGSPDPYGAYVSVSDVGSWGVTPNGTSGELDAIHQLGGMLFAFADGCLGGAETAELTLEGHLKPHYDNDKGKRGDDDDDKGKGKRGNHDDDKGKGKRDDDHDGKSTRGEEVEVEEDDSTGTRSKNSDTGNRGRR